MNQLQKALSEPRPAERVCKLLKYLQELELDRERHADGRFDDGCQGIRHLIDKARYELGRAMDEWRVSVGIAPINGSGITSAPRLPALSLAKSA